MKNKRAFFRKFEENYNALKATPEFKRHQFYNKSKLKLVLVVFPILIALCLFIRKFIPIEGYTFYVAIIFIAIIVVNFGADYLTRKKFKD